MRLDLCIKDKLNISRQKAREIIEQGLVTVDKKNITKPSYNVNEDADINVGSTESILKYVGRGGYKLEKAIDFFNINLTGYVCIDIGASTGGFTDCMLQNGANKVYAIDVGTDQLSPMLLNDNRVISWENTDIRNVTKEMVDNGVDFVGCDVSFISLKRIFPEIKKLLKPNSIAVVLIKPQFECGREFLSRSGIVKNPKVHKNVIKNTVLEASGVGLSVIGLTNSPIKGGDGNTEYLLYLKNEPNPINHIELSYIENLVKSQFEG